MIRVSYSSKYMIDRLVSFGVIPRKTRHETMGFVPDIWKPDFIRGYFDGDGCVYTRKNRNDFECSIC